MARDRRQAEDVVKWLEGLRWTEWAKPVVVAIDGKQYEGAFYKSNFKFSTTERAVTSGQVKAGEVRFEYLFYLLGKYEYVPSRDRGQRYRYNSDYPLDERIERHSGEWYVSCFHDWRYSGPTSEIASPLGPFFMLKEWTIPTYGPYKDQGMEYGERYKRKWTNISVEWLHETSI